MNIISFDDAKKHIKRVYIGIKNQEQFDIADTYCKLLLSKTKPYCNEHDQLVDYAISQREPIKEVIRVEEINEKLNKNIDIRNYTIPCSQCKYQ